MPFQRGISGNPGGRPKKGDSFAEFVRGGFKKPDREQALKKIIAIATGQHDDHKARILAFTALHRAGWPHEQRPDVQVTIPLIPLFQMPAYPALQGETRALQAAVSDECGGAGGSD